MKPLLKPVPSHPGYYAGDDGGIYSDHTNKRWGHNKPPRKLVPGRQKNGYLMLRLVRPEGGYKCQRVHSLVCEAFHGPRPEGTECSHKDDNKNNNVPTNLCWETPLENQRRRHANGIDDRGTKNSRSKFSVEDVIQIRRWLDEGKSTVWIANTFGVSRPVISRIKNGRRYQNDG